MRCILLGIRVFNDGNLKYGFNFHGLNNQFPSSLYILVIFIFKFHMLAESTKNLIRPINMINILIFIIGYVLSKIPIVFH